jgi:hypothetical protein
VDRHTASRGSASISIIYQILNKLIPIVELDVQTPLDGSSRRTLGTLNPGVVWQISPGFQVAVEAIVPINTRTTPDVGVRVGINFFLNRLAPKSVLGHPLLERVL